MKRHRTTKLVALAACSLLLAAGCGSSNGGSSSGATGTPQPSTGASDQPTPGSNTPVKSLGTWKHGVVQLQGDSGFVEMAKEQGFFEKRGLNVEFVTFNSDQTMLQALIAGEIDSGESNPAGMIRSVQAGSDLKIIGSTVEGLAWSIFAKKGTTSLADLKGKTVGTSTPGSLPDVFVKAALEAKGIDPNSVTFANVGAGPSAYAALVAGQIAAVPLSDEYRPQAEKDGIAVLAPAYEVTPDYPRRMIMGKASTFEKKKDATVAFLAGEIEGQHYSLSHRDDEIALSAKLTKRDVSDPSLGLIYDELVKNNMVSKNLDIPTNKIQWLQDTLVKLKAIPKETPVDQLVDDSYLKQAQSLVNG